MSPEAATRFVVTACAVACLLCLLAARGRDSRLWAGVAVVMAVFAAHKAFGGQAAAVRYVERFAQDGGWYALRRAPQWLVSAAVLLVGGIAGALVLKRTARRPAAARAATALATLLVAYALLGMVSLHAWDRLVSRRLGGLETYTMIELAIPLAVCGCALLGGRGGARRRRG